MNVACRYFLFCFNCFKVISVLIVVYFISFVNSYCVWSFYFHSV